MAYNISVDKEECIGCGACVAVCDNFELDDENIAVPKNPIIQEEELESNQSAVDACPKQCINIDEE
jgi:ferredoxin